MKDHLEAFAGAITNVLTQIGSEGVVKGECETPEDMFCKHEVIIIIGLTLDLRGSIAYSMSPSTAINIASTMMCGMPIAELDDMARSAVCEFANMSAGAGVSTLPKEMKVDITPPTMIIGQKMALMMGSYDVLKTRITTPWGEIELRLSIEQ
ncbi:conserved hypothetical protein [Candidatus Desulfosporosinus infrequens]|uniref:Chemotaxis phosphatase CheX-like domain-containing protein n=1 Tax=Candidatus Desulfosporosinus infrequens TaxID=2043169 RepID=A0A2U3L0S6_9FIRM|nr:conserved hypothetical protein [Candidatus Desulfosporosinus infrequens]